MPAKEIHNLSVIHMSLLKKIVESGSAGIAAEELGLSASSVSYRLASMREIFKDELFIRTHDGLKPTVHCRRLALGINDILNRIEQDLFHAGDFDPQQINRRLTVHGMVSSMGWFTHLFSELAGLCPRLNLSCHSWNSHSQADIVSGKVDFGIHIIESELAGIHELNLGETKRIIVVHRDHPLTKVGAVTLEDFSNYPVLMNDLCWNSYAGSFMEKIIAGHGFKLNVKGSFGDCKSLFDTIRKGTFITYTSTLALPDDLTDLAIIAPPPELVLLNSSYHLKMSSQNYGSQEYAWLAETITKSFKEYVARKNGRPELQAFISPQGTST
ncbi:LysR family transcriptional regulator [Shewanella youngdeokensis]|uniref:LysR family transcriptional regulator n=1 Tax=Shewanella youngdeokensis TaxID=2999068 RepID=A0ABZ0JUY3_9GAMM|nr:LysR family transcriptional regulator [Shewanella sp. DAU334]